MKYKHSDEFYKKQYIKYKEQIVGKSLFNNFNSFKGRYKAAEAANKKNITKNFVYETNYEIDYDTYRAEREMNKEFGMKVRKKELLHMSTREFADIYDVELMNMYNLYKTEHTGKEAALYISEYVFGS